MALSLYYIIHTCIYIHIYIIVHDSATRSRYLLLDIRTYMYHTAVLMLHSFQCQVSSTRNYKFIYIYIYMYICIYIVAIYPSPIRIYVSISCTPMIYPTHTHTHTLDSQHIPTSTSLYISNQY